MSREDEIDDKMLGGFYFAYKDGKPAPTTVRHHSLKDINITADEFLASQRRLMQRELLNGSKKVTRGGTIYSPNEISEKGIRVYEENNVDPLFRGMEFIDTGFSGKKYCFLKWVRKNPKWIITLIIGIVGVVLTSITLF